LVLKEKVLVLVLTKKSWSWSWKNMEVLVLVLTKKSYLHHWHLYCDLHSTLPNSEPHISINFVAIWRRIASPLMDRFGHCLHHLLED